MAAATAGRPRLRQEAKSYIVATLGEVAEFFGVGLSAVNDWRADSEPMPGSQGAWDLAAIAKWKLGRGRKTGGLSDELKAAEIRLKTAQAKAKEIENDISSGELLDRGDVERTFAEALILLREVVMSIPEVIAVSAPPEVRDIARQEADLKCRAGLTAARQILESQQSQSKEDE